jgi:hypothetical protein
LAAKKLRVRYDENGSAGGRGGIPPHGWRIARLPFHADPIWDLTGSALALMRHFS